MKRFLSAIWIGWLGLGAIGNAEAQELQQSANPLPKLSRPVWFSLNPFTRGSLAINSLEEWIILEEEAKRSLHERWSRQAGSTLDPIRRQLECQFSHPVKVSLRVGNSAVNNWSPFPDRALDARVIRYPMPRSAAFGKRGGR